MEKMYLMIQMFSIFIAIFIKLLRIASNIFIDLNQFVITKKNLFEEKSERT